MKALLIEPELCKVSLILYNSLRYEDFSETVAHILGSTYTWETEFPNGDGLFAQASCAYNYANRAFTLNCTDTVFFGKCLIASVSIPFMRLRNCKFTLKELNHEIHFFDRTWTELYRQQII